MADLKLDPDTAQRRAEIARRLKAARWLAGGMGPAKRGKTGYEVTALPIASLAKRAPLAENEITANKLGAIERMERRATPMELECIALGLGVAPDYFTQAREEPLPSIRTMLTEQTGLLERIDSAIAEQREVNAEAIDLRDAIRGLVRPEPTTGRADRPQVPPPIAGAET